MELTGNIKDISRDIFSNKFRILLEVNEKPTGIEKLTEQELNIKLTKHRNKRSLDANAYAWVLMQKIAEAVESDRWSIYLTMLQRYSRAFTFVIVKENAVERMKELYRTCVDLGEIDVGGMTAHQLQVFYGSSTFDTKEMSVFIDGIVSECRELGIETMTPAELEKMQNAWQPKEQTV